jgi:glycosyltransferase involved in cell wall biosynthesis
MRLALLTHKVDVNDGQGRVNYEIVLGALRSGHHVTVVAEYCSEKIARHTNAVFVQMRKRPVPTQLLRNLYYAIKSTIWLRKHRDEFDLVQVNGFVTWGRADIVAVHYVHLAWMRSAYFPFRLSSLHPYHIYQVLLTWINGHFERRVYRQARMVIAVSAFTASEVVGLGISADKVCVIHNGVNTDNFSPGTSVREEFHLPGGLVGLFVGDIKTSRKNLDAALKAMREVPAMHLAVAGALEGSPYPEIVRSMGLAERVTFTGKTTRMAELMRSVDFFVFPSHYEAHPLVILEAMASGLPVIVSRNFGAADYVGQGGLVYGDSRDVTALLLALRRIAGEPQLRASMAAEARRLSLSMNWIHTADAYLDVYEQLLKTKAGRGAIA